MTWLIFSCSSCRSGLVEAGDPSTASGPEPVGGEGEQDVREARRGGPGRSGPEDGWQGSLAAALEVEQGLDDRINLVRPDWEAQMSQAQELLLGWTGQVRTSARALV